MSGPICPFCASQEGVQEHDDDCPTRAAQAVSDTLIERLNLLEAKVKGLEEREAERLRRVRSPL